MKYIFQLGIICSVSLAGELLHTLLPFPVPASVYGLVLMFLLLCTGLVKLSWIEETADYFLLIMPLLFIEPSVRLMTSVELIRGSVLSLLALCMVSWAVVIVVTGRVTQAVIRQRKKREAMRSAKEE
ncbi:MAG: CidA/LrgA family protein [Lachnospiraceae bacterium]|nr:CidA/LrgA family protein [Lachnospiraceae bacterium]